MKKQKFFLSILLIVIPATSSCLVARPSGADRTPFSVIRTPDGGLAPEVSLDKNGILHLTYGKDSEATTCSRVTEARPLVRRSNSTAALVP